MAGERQILFDAPGLPPGLYPYRIHLENPVGGAARSALSGKMIVTK